MRGTIRWSLYLVLVLVGTSLLLTANTSPTNVLVMRMAEGNPEFKTGLASNDQYIEYYSNYYSTNLVESAMLPGDSASLGGDSASLGGDFCKQQLGFECQFGDLRVVVDFRT